MIQPETFVENDLEEIKKLDSLISKKATWNVTTAEAIQLYRSLVWFSSLSKKIKDNIFEIKKVTQTKKTKAKKEKL